MLAKTKEIRTRDRRWRDDEQSDAAHEPDQPENTRDDLAAARGLIYAIGISALIWLLLILIIQFI